MNALTVKSVISTPQTSGFRCSVPSSVEEKDFLHLVSFILFITRRPLLLQAILFAHLPPSQSHPTFPTCQGTRLPSVMQCSQTACCSWAVPVPHQLLKMRIPLEVCWGDETKGSLAHRVPLLAGLTAAGTGEPPAQNSPPAYRWLQVGLLEPSEARTSKDILREFILLFLN